jgi:hypothetical protein
LTKATVGNLSISGTLIAIATEEGNLTSGTIKNETQETGNNTKLKTSTRYRDETTDNDDPQNKAKSPL